MLRQSLPLTLGYSVEVAPSLRGLADHLDRKLDPQRGVVVTNPTVRALHGAALAEELKSLPLSWIEIPDGEEHKTLDGWQRVVAEILAGRPDRRTVVIAFGGGVIGDLAGFSAACVLRGLPLVQVPTTLLAMVDASVGGKTGVNTPAGKNLVGAFYQPTVVWAALETLSTLPARELRCGLGEVVKHAVLAGEIDLAALEASAHALRSGDPAALAAAILASIAVKARIVERDPTEHGERALLNLGHTLGHAIETTGGYGRYSHGAAVAIGTMAVARLGMGAGVPVDVRFVDRLEGLFHALGLPVHTPDELNDAALIEAMGFDKKRERGMVKLVIPVAPGDVRVRLVPESGLACLAAAGRRSP